MRSEAELEGVTLLGNTKTQYKTTYSPEVLEKFPNKHPGNDYMVTFNCPEFTSLCPKTGQPDFAEIKINYIPDQYLVESKSLRRLREHHHEGFGQAAGTQVPGSRRPLYAPRRHFALPVRQLRQAGYRIRSPRQDPPVHRYR